MYIKTPSTEMTEDEIISPATTVDDNTAGEAQPVEKTTEGTAQSVEQTADCVVQSAEQTADSVVQSAERTAEGTPTPAAEESIVLKSEGLIKRYGKRTVVNDVSFEVRQGEIVGLLGPNGAGKTTSFYMTTGLMLPNGGHIYLSTSGHVPASAIWHRSHRCFAR